MSKSTSDILDKTKKSLGYIKDIGTLTLEKESLKLKRIATFADLGKKVYELHVSGKIDIPEISDLLRKADFITETIESIQERIDSKKN